MQGQNKTLGVSSEKQVSLELGIQMSWQSRCWYDEIVKIQWIQEGNANMTPNIKMQRLELTLSIIEVILEESNLTSPELRLRYSGLIAGEEFEEDLFC